ncbi:Carboxy-terminal domain (CTD) phosphatase [Rhizophlyctis rosea]|uniref:RNA polymerase II subunit A C-terminal domain phosphatase n=1 Tax=Rhizophlyctis rosea TaxID=64517 RepID=A0AAD5X472_9FUNG|nr:Carboxy-terminal domain (CTD) phosphatase [Rhizophlyctis rosea]
MSDLAAIIPGAKYPVKIKEVFVKPGDTVKKDAPLLTYWSGNNPDHSQPPAILKSPKDGKVKIVRVKVGERCGTAREPPLELENDCDHPGEYNGICVKCGNPVPEEHLKKLRHTLTHDAKAVRVTDEEAQRIDSVTNEQLIKDRKLTLILDLDQTLIHATVDPTIEEWRKDQTNPNHNAAMASGPTYYIKLRPGTKEFLQNMRALYDMHVYTMGTRNYAEHVAEVLDPGKDIFKEKILSRDESGSFVHKSIERLFPKDQSMAVIVDDRADVWNYSDHLIRIKPYDFFVGIGDINAPFNAAAHFQDGTNGITKNKKGAASGVASGSTSVSAAPKEPAPAEDEEEDVAKFLATAEDEQRHLLDEQKNERPLAKLESEDDANKDKDPAESEEPTGASPIPQEPKPTPSGAPSTPGKRRRQVLVDNDQELDRISEILTEMHGRFYEVREKAERAHIGEIMRVMKKEVLRGTTLVYSGLVPTGGSWEDKKR